MKKNIIYLSMAAGLVISGVAYSQTMPGSARSESPAVKKYQGSTNSTGISSDGKIRDTSGAVVGAVVDSKDPTKKGTLSPDGISSDGTIKDTDGAVVGEAVDNDVSTGADLTSGGIKSDGTIVDTNGEIVGHGVVVGTKVDNTLTDDGVLISSNTAKP